MDMAIQEAVHSFMVQLKSPPDLAEVASEPSLQIRRDIVQKLYASLKRPALERLEAACSKSDGKIIEVQDNPQSTYLIVRTKPIGTEQRLLEELLAGLPVYVLDNGIVAKPLS